MFKGQSASLSQGCGILPGARLQKPEEELPRTVEMLYRWIWVKGSEQTLHDTVRMAHVTWKYHGTEPVCLPLRWGTFVQESQVQ